MKRGVIALVLFGILLVSPLVLAQEKAQTYSSFGRFIDNVKMFFSSGDNKVILALEIREKEVDSAIINSQNQNEKDAIKNLEKAYERLQFVNEKISLDVTDEVKSSVDEIVNKIEDEEALSDNFDVYVLEEKKTYFTAVLTEEIFEMCKELAEEDYTALLQEEECNPETAVPGLEKELKELRRLQEESFNKLMLDIRSCMDDPGTCNCEDISDINERVQCEKMIAFAVKCEYKNDQEACNQMESMRPPAESFVPDFLMNLFREKEGMIDYNIEHSEEVPPECWNENTKPECEQYMYMKETRAKCWDKEGNFNYEECGGPKSKEPTMQESIPQCFDENDNFLEEKCGKIIIVKNKDGLINYLIEKEIDNVINEFENKSIQHTVDINGTLRQDVSEAKEEINNIDKNVSDWVVDHPVNDEEGDDGLTWEVKTEVAEDGGGSGGLKPEIETNVADGDGGLTPEVKTDVASEEHEDTNVVDEGPGER